MLLRSCLGGLAALSVSSCIPSPEAEFWGRVSSLCGKAYEGHVVSEDAADDGWRSERIVMHVRDCSKSEIRIPLSVGEDRSRTWVLARAKGGLALHHEHRHADGSLDAVTGYGGTAADYSSGSRQNFPADAATQALFEQEGIPESKANIWAIEARPAHTLLAYEMERPGRFFRLEFDTGKPVTPPEAFEAAD
tara:strand:- start:138645 stop:139220 length:576 start_codon:yes stop_codon:yes gene_type:complete